MSKYVVTYKVGEQDDKRPWGKWVTTAVGHLSPDEGELAFCDKDITVNPGKELSIQKHEFRKEDWTMISGSAVVYIGSSPTELVAHRLKAGDSIHIPCGAWHRIANEGGEPVLFKERQSGIYLDEKDILRYATPKDPRTTDEKAMIFIRAEVKRLGFKWPSQPSRDGVPPRYFGTTGAIAYGTFLSLSVLSSLLI